MVLSTEQKLGVGAIKHFEKKSGNASEMASEINMVIKTAANNDSRLSKRKPMKMTSLD